MEIKPLKEVAKQAFQELYKYQSGEKKIVKTGEEMIDCHIGGLLPGDVIVISAPSGHGKSEKLFKLKEQILDKEINENADNYVFLDVSLEMRIFNIVVRGINRKLSKKKRDILFNEFSKKEKKKVKKYYESLQDDRQFIDQAPSNPEDFYEGCKNFLKEHKDKEAVFISIDHLLLVAGSDKQKVLEDLIENINQLKLRFHNVYFILLSQTNRSLITRIAERNNNAAPCALDIFGSSYMEHLAGYNIVIYNPYKMGIQSYMRVNPDRYDYLSEYFNDEEDSKGRVSFDTTARLFFHVIKTRESDTPFKDIFIEEMNLSDEVKEKMKPIDKVEEEKAPKFKKLPDAISFNEDDEDDDNNTPF